MLVADGTDHRASWVKAALTDSRYAFEKDLQLDMNAGRARQDQYCSCRRLALLAADKTLSGNSHSNFTFFARNYFPRLLP